MIRLLVFLLSFGIICHPFSELIYYNTPKEHFEFSGNYYSMGIEDELGNKPITIGSYGFNFRFDFIGYGFQLIPYKLPSGSQITWTNHNIFFQLYENLNFGPLILSSQAGVVNVGIPRSAYNDQILNFMQQYFVAHKIKLNGLTPIEFYTSSGPNGTGSQFVHRAGVAYLYQKNRFFIEFSPNQNVYFAGLDVYLSKQSILSLATNLSITNSNVQQDPFTPSIHLGLTFINPFVKLPPKKKPIPPVDIDKNTFLILEKGLIAYYESDFKSSIKYHQSVIKEYPGFSLAHTRLANSYYKLGNLKLAKKHWQTALKLDPKNSDLITILSRIQNNELVEVELIKD